MTLHGCLKYSFAPALLCSVLSGCGGGGSSDSASSNSRVDDTDPHPCAGVDLGIHAPSKLLPGMTIDQANEAIGCPAERVAEDPVTYTWFDGEVDHFGVNLNESGLVNSIFVFDDWITCEGISFSNSTLAPMFMDYPLTLPIAIADYSIGCTGQLKSVDYDLTEGTNSGLVQYLNGEGKEINVIFQNGLILTAILMNSPVKGEVPSD